MVRASPFLTFAVFFVGLSLGSSGVRADPPQGTLNRSISTSGPISAPPAGAPPRNWSQETEATCGMACRYHHANDNLTMQALYLVTKVSKVQTAIKADPKSAEARITLGAFCTDGAEDLDACFNRYKDFQKLALLDIRQAIGKNEDSIARLTTGRKADGTVPNETAISFSSGEEEHPYVPDVPTLSDLENSYLQGKLKPAGQAYSRAEIQKWSESLIINDPRTRYLQFSKTPAVGNPYQEEKSSYSVYMEQRDDNGNSAGPDGRAVKIYKDAEKSVQEFAKDKDKKIDGKNKVVAPSKSLKKDDSISYEAFVQARSVINTKIQGDEQRRDQEAKDRRLASQKPNPQPSAGASPEPKDDDNADSRAAREVKVTTAGSGAQVPHAYHTFGPDENVDPPKEMKNSRYIKYDLGDLMFDIDQK